MTYTRQFLDVSGGASLTPLELRGTTDLLVAERFFSKRERLRTWCEDRHLRFGCDLHMTADANCFRSAGGGELVLHEGKTFHQYTDSWGTKPRYGVARAALKPSIAEAVRYYRLAFRDIARSNDERTMIACIAPPLVVFSHTATVEKVPWARTNADALVLCALFNSFPFDWLVRQKAATHLSLYILDALPVPRFEQATRRFLAHDALRLSCNHAAYDALWRDEVGGDQGIAVPRRELRAQIDAVVADAYGLNRNDYERVLSNFSHRSDPAAAAVCLAELDLVQLQGIDAFCRLRDPYQHLALITATAKPIDYAPALAGGPDSSFVNDRHG
jgi:hypothetical protein